MCQRCLAHWWLNYSGLPRVHVESIKVHARGGRNITTRQPDPKDESVPGSPSFDRQVMNEVAGALGDGNPCALFGHDLKRNCRGYLGIFIDEQVNQHRWSS